MTRRRSAFTLTLFAAVLAGGAVHAWDDARFNLICRDIAQDGSLSSDIGDRFSVDLETMRVCRRNNSRCFDIVDHGRWLEFSYDFDNEDGVWRMFRLYDRQTGWLDQMIRPVGEPGQPFGDSVCERIPFEPFNGMS